MENIPLMSRISNCDLMINIIIRQREMAEIQKAQNDFRAGLQRKMKVDRKAWQ